MLKYAIHAPWKRTTSFGRYRPVLFAWNQCWLYYTWQQFGWWVCSKAIKKMVRKYPHLKEELEQDFRHGKFGKECDEKYWETIE
jgi:hypothetical protein